MRLSLSGPLLLCALLASPAFAGPPRSCGHCGCCEQVRKVCRIVCEMEEVKTVTYDCECEDFCTPGPSYKCGCREICTCGKVRTRRKLVKHEVVKKVPKYRCVVEYYCPDCRGGAPVIAHHPTAAERPSGPPATLTAAPVLPPLPPVVVAP